MLMTCGSSSHSRYALYVFRDNKYHAPRYDSLNYTFLLYFGLGQVLQGLHYLQNPLSFQLGHKYVVEVTCCFSVINGNISHTWCTSLQPNPALRSASTDTLHLPKSPQAQTMCFPAEIKSFCSFRCNYSKIIHRH